MKFDVYQEVTDAIIKALEDGVKPWECPWMKSGGGAPLRSTGEPYRGINTLLLGLRAFVEGYGNPVWMTFKQAKDFGGMVKKGEKSSLVVKYGTFEKVVEHANSGDETLTRGYLKAYRVFNIAQIEGLDAQFPTPAQPTPLATRPIEELSHVAAAMISGSGVNFAEGGDRAFYSLGADRVTMPELSRFESAERYNSTLFHELVHSTMLASRCDRVTAVQGSAFGNATYAKEELVAEMGAAFLGAQLGFEPSHIDDSAAYIGSWLSALRHDKRLIVRQAAAAQKAADYLLNVSQQERAQAA